MGKVLSPPEAVGPTPQFQPGELFDAYLQRQLQFVEAVKEWAKTNGSGRYAGEEVHFPQGDGQARYVIESTKPLVLIWLPVGDAWQYPHIERLLAKDITQQVERQRELAKLFAPK